MSLETNRFEFGDFLLDVKENVLLRNGKPLSITPKAFQLLHLLVENHGHLIERDVLLNTVWADSFVEEGNLTFTIRLLRKALDDSKKNPRFIETVPKRGYRFVAEVRQNIQEVEVKQIIQENAYSEPLEKNFSAPPIFNKFLLPTVAVLIILIFAGFWFVRSKNIMADAPVLNTPFSSEKLSTNGKVLRVVISPDGKNMVYTNGGSHEKQSVWLRQLESSNNVEIIPPSDDTYYGLALSPDGNFLYFSRSPKTNLQQDIYRVSIFGGIPNKIIDNTEGWMSISPDGAKISFVRCPRQTEENCSLWIANAADGKNERKLASRPHPLRIGDNRISPDGRSIAFAVGQSENQANEFGLVKIDIETGAERELTTRKFFNIRYLTWLPDGGSLLLTASQIPNKIYRIWQVSANTGEVQLLTKDSESYSALSLDTAARHLISTEVRQDFKLSLWQTKNSFAAPQVLADATNITFAPNGKIIFTSWITGNDEIWSINTDGSGRHQLTNDAADDRAPIVSADNNFIFFASNRTGEAHVWRMNADGSNQTQITRQEGGYPLFVTPDGKWLYYHHAINRTLWRVSTAGGDAQVVFNKTGFRFAVSPDGSQAALPEKQGAENILEIISLADGQTVKTFKLADQSARLIEVKWSPDGKNLAYILADNKFEHNFLWFQPLNAKTPRQIAALGDEVLAASSFALAPDGKSFAVAQGRWLHDAVLLRGLK